MVMIIVGAVLLVLLLSGWLMDRSAKRRGAHPADSRDIVTQVREGARDARVIDSGLMPPRGQDYEWTSWHRRSKR